MLAIRPATASDRDFVIATARRFAAFGPPPWRTPLEIVTGEVQCLDGFFDGAVDGAALVVAEEDGRPVGFAFLERHTDYFTGEGHGHIGMLAVIEAAEGRGVGAALLGAADDWARARGYSTLTLNVFEGNARARRAYERAGFLVETLKYVKPLR